MVDVLIDALSGLSAGWLVFIISMLPIAELRVGIPLGIAMGMPAWETFLIAIIGNGLVAVPVLVLLPKVFELLRKIRPIAPVVDKIIARGHHKASGMNAKSFIGLMLFVGIPLPGTGVWTGCLVAYLLSMRIRYAALAVICGMLIAAVLVTVSSMGVFTLLRSGGVEYVLGLLLIIIVAIFIWRRYKKKQ